MINDFYDDSSEPIVKLEAFYGPRRNLAEKCLVIFSKTIYEHLLQQYACTQIAQIDACNGDRPIWTFTDHGEDIAFYLSPLGSALAGTAVVEANHLTGVRTFIMFGSCGTLDPGSTNGKWIVPTKAYRGEGFSYYFVKSGDYIDIRNADKVADIFSEQSIPFVKGKVWTTDCMLRETAHLAARRKQEGCIAVEMELAGVQAACDFYGFELFDFLVAGDIVTEGSYDASGLSDANHQLDKLSLALLIAQKTG